MNETLLENNTSQLLHGLGVIYAAAAGVGERGNASTPFRARGGKPLAALVPKI